MTTKVTAKDREVLDARKFLKEMHRIDDQSGNTKKWMIEIEKEYMGRYGSWGWLEELQGMTREEIRERGYSYEDAWMTGKRNYKKLTREEYDAICEKRIAKLEAEEIK